MLVRLVSLLLLALGVDPVAPSAQAGGAPAPGLDRIVAVGDVHGDFNQFVTVLRQAGVIDGKNHWSGGRTHLVQTGDVPDRGPDTRKALDLLMELEKEAERAGGKVHALIGNHEAMNMQGDLRYVTPAEFAAFKTGESEAVRNRAFASLADPAKKDDAEYRKQWDTEHPLGWVEHRLAFAPSGKYGSWIRRHDAVLKLDDYLFLHGGISPKYADRAPADLNAAIQQELAAADSRTEPGVVEDTDGPLWYRGMVADDSVTVAQVDQVLQKFGVKHVVIGHTPTAGTVIPRLGGKVIMIDVGMSAAYGGPPASLVIEQGKPSTIHRGQKLELPTGPDIVPYLKAAAALDPQPSRLQKLIDQLEAGTPAPSRP